MIMIIGECYLMSGPSLSQLVYPAAVPSYHVLLLTAHCSLLIVHKIASLYDHILIDDPITQGGEKEDCGVEGGNPNSCKGAFIKVEGLQLFAEDDINEDVELESQFRHILDVLVDEHEGNEIPFLSNAKSNLAYVMVGKSRIFLSQLNGNLFLSKDWLT